MHHQIPGRCDVSRDLHHMFYQMFWNQNERSDGAVMLYSEFTAFS